MTHDSTWTQQDSLNAHTVNIRSFDVEGLFVRSAEPAGGAVFRTPLVFVHGRCHGAWAYEKWLSYFAAAGWPTYALSLRHHPGSWTGSMEERLTTTMEQYGSDLRTVLNWVGDVPVLLGHSLGGILVQQVAQQVPAAALVLLASVGPSQLGRHGDDYPTDRLVDDRDVYLARGENLYVDRLVGESPTALNQVRGRTPIDATAITAPVLAIGGALDDTGVHDAGRVADFYGGDWQVVDGATHDFMLDSSALRVAALIHSWLADTLWPAQLAVHKGRRLTS